MAPGMNDSIIQLDARRLLCPMPVIRLQNCLQNLTPGAQVEITCTDPGCMSDIPTWCRINAHRVLSSKEQADEYIFLVEKGADEP